MIVSDLGGARRRTAVFTSVDISDIVNRIAPKVVSKYTASQLYTVRRGVRQCWCSGFVF